jgi:hypothetical protein
MICIDHNRCDGDKIEKYEMGRACSAFGVGRGVYRCLMERPEGKSNWGEAGLDGKIILG